MSTKEPPTVNREPQDNETSDAVIADGGLAFVRGKGGNDAPPAYQEASGAPLEEQSPLGYHISTFTLVCLGAGRAVGTGVFSTPASIVNSLGSVGLSLIYWFLGFFFAGCGQAIYLELASYFPSRSGGEVVYLEQAYPRPKYFFPIAFAVQSVIFESSGSNTIVLAEYLFQVTGHNPAPWELKGFAIASYTAAVLLVIFHTKFSLYFSNTITTVKVFTLVFVSVTGLVVLGGHTSVPDPRKNFRNAFEGTTSGGYDISNALVKVTFAYGGYQNAFSFVNEVKNPIKRLRVAAPLSLLLVATLYMLCNIAYFAAVPKEEIAQARQVTVSLFFQGVFKSTSAARGLNMLVVLSAFGSLINALLQQSRIIRECGRQGVLPWPRFWASTRPFGTPIGPYFAKWVITLIFVLSPPAGDAFNFMADLAIYPDAVFYFCLAAGVIIIRRQRKRISADRPQFKAWNVALAVYLAVNAFLLVMPWYPPEGGMFAGDVSFWYATYCVVGLGIIGLCGVYHYVWFKLLPRLRGSRIRQEVIILENGASTHRILRVPLEDLEKWDLEHDILGNELRGTAGGSKGRSTSSLEGIREKIKEV